MLVKGAGLRKLKKLGRCGFVEYHHLGDKGLNVSDMCETATCGEQAKVLVDVAPKVGLVVILRKQF